jgi:amino acid adenylation domain-containing protein
MNDNTQLLALVDHDPFVGPPLAAFAPITESQREIWLACMIDPDLNIGYNEGLGLRMEGAVDVEVLRRSLQVLVDRHESLRTTFSPDGNWLCIHEKLIVDVPLVEAPDDARHSEICERVMRTRFDLENGPLANFTLVRRDERHYSLLFVAHHLVVDGWSAAVLLTELGELYSAGVENREAKLDAPPRYTEYANVERAFLDSGEGQKQERYWLERLHDLPPTLDIPSSRPRPAQRRFEADRIDRRLPQELVIRLRKTAAQQGASLVAMMLAGFSTLLHRLTAAEDMVIGLAAAGQSMHQQGGLVGHCVNLLPLRLHPRAEMTFKEFLGQTKTVVLDASDHQGITFGALIPKLAVPRDDSRAPLVSVVFNIDVRDDNISHTGLAVSYTTLVRRAETFEIFINVVDDGLDLVAEVSYGESLFSAEDIHHLLDRYQAVLDAACREPGAPLGAIALTSAEERHQLTAGLNPPATPIDFTPVHERLAAQARAGTARTAVSFGSQRYSYAELDARVDAIAAALQQRGAGPGQFVAVCVERGLDLPAALLGVLRTGAAYLPLDPDFPEERLAYMLADSKATLAITERALTTRLAGASCPLLCLEDIAAGNKPTLIARGAGDAAYVIYTSGSTGKPKGVVVPHGGLCNFLDSMAKEPGLGPDDALLAVTTVSFDIAGLELYLPLVQGARVVIAERETAIDGARLAALLASESIDVMQATPATWRLLLSAGWAGKPGFRAFCGGEPLPRDLAEALLPKIGALWNLYGPTETTIWSTAWRVPNTEGAMLIGKPIANTRCYVLDARQGLLPQGAIGELWIGGDGVAIGYHDRAELTAERFQPDPYSDRPGARMYRTGDLARWTGDGELECLGRTDFQVKLRGYRIELGEIESELNGHVTVADSACGVRERGAGDSRLVAWVVGKPGAAVDPGELREHLRRSLPGYMVPQTFRVLDALPRLPNGKLDRKSLPDPFGDAASAPIKTPLTTPTQQSVRDIWAEVLGVSDIGADDRFFDLGGHSLLAMQTAARIQKTFGVKLPLRTVMMESVRATAEAIDRAVPPSTKPAATADQKPAPTRATPAAEARESGGTLSRLKRWLGG